jgi:hypothetical protein
METREVARFIGIYKGIARSMTIRRIFGLIDIREGIFNLIRHP